MKNNTISITNVITLILGIIIIAFHGQVLNTLVMFVGIIFLIPGIIASIEYFQNKKKNIRSSTLLISQSIGSSIFGLILLFFPNSFTNLIIFLLGLIIIINGFFQIYSLALASKEVKVGIPYFLVPILIIIACIIGGVIAVRNPNFVKDVFMLIIGIGLVISSLSNLANFYFVKKKTSSYQEKNKSRISDTKAL